jgi:hypothetical protein
VGILGVYYSALAIIISSILSDAMAEIWSSMSLPSDMRELACIAWRSLTRAPSLVVDVFSRFRRGTLRLFRYIHNGIKSIYEGARSAAMGWYLAAAPVRLVLFVVRLAQPAAVMALWIAEGCFRVICLTFCAFYMASGVALFVVLMIGLPTYNMIAYLAPRLAGCVKLVYTKVPRAIAERTCKYQA